MIMPNLKTQNLQTLDCNSGSFKFLTVFYIGNG